MDYEFLKEEFIKLKKEELDYIDNISKLSKSKKFTEYEKIEIYRKLKSYEIKINEMYKLLFVEARNEFKKNEEELMKRHLRDIIIVQFDVNKDFLSSIDFSYDDDGEYLLSILTLLNLIVNTFLKKYFYFFKSIFYHIFAAIFCHFLTFSRNNFVILTP